ncbi:MAG TPA: hypothetical protein VL563_15880 [Gemmatimonadales bacterium]|jgi:hypothetical protein|nr:hypothetical protein [Gemmatimonadales bacterium]
MTTKEQMQAVRFRFDGPTFDGFADGTRWNGFLNVWVTPETRDAIVAWLEQIDDDPDTIADLRALPVKRGLVSLAYGYATMEVTCPDDCTNTDGTCPRCYAETGNGCAHGPLCADCREEAAPRFSVRSIDPRDNCDGLTLDGFSSISTQERAAINRLAVGETVEISGDRITRTA